jgi:hypothetical protein
MPLSFPNQSRSYDASKQRVRFWAYDQALEISFFVEASALRSGDPQAARSEATILGDFDRDRSKILRAAGRIYSRHSKGSYTLTAADLA